MISTDTALGFVRHIGKACSGPSQCAALHAAGIDPRRIYNVGRKGETRDEMMRAVRPGTAVVVRCLFVLGEPRNKRKRGGLRRDILAALHEIEDRGGHVVEVGGEGRSTLDARQRDAMIADANEAVTTGRQPGLSVKRGRPPKPRSKDWLAIIALYWTDVVKYATNDDALRALKKEQGIALSHTQAFRLMATHRGHGGSGRMVGRTRKSKKKR